MSQQHTATMYHIYAFLDGEYVMQTDSFLSKSRCRELMDELTDSGSHRFTFQMIKSTPKGECINGVGDTYIDLSQMTLENYKKGLLLRPPFDDSDTGSADKYFMGGWWIPKHFAWFFKMKDLDMLLDHGADYITPDSCEDMYVQPHESDDSMDVTEDSVNSENVKVIDESTTRVDFTNCFFENYGKGLIVYPYRSHRDFGKKYYGEGWWMPSQKGWFFRKEFYTQIEKYGASFSEHNDMCCDHEDDEPEVLDFHDSMKLEKYGRGYILTPHHTHPHYGEKYYRDGWWMSSMKSWFFKKEFVDPKTKLLKNR